MCMLNVCVDEGLQCFLGRTGLHALGWLFSSLGMGDMSIDVVSRCQQGKAFGVVGLGVLSFCFF